MSGLSEFASAYYDELMQYPQWVANFRLKAAQELANAGYGELKLEGCEFDPEPYVFVPKGM